MKEKRLLARFASLLSLVASISCAGWSSPAPPPSAGATLPQAIPSLPVVPHPLAHELVPVLPDRSPVTVLPIFFVPRDVALPDLTSAERLLKQHLDVARAHYAELLGTTFTVAPGASPLYRSPNPDSWFYDVDPERAPRVLRELFAFLRTDRYAANVVLLTIYVSARGRMSGGGMPFNGTLGTGGGYVELEYASLATDRPYPFQSSLVHELGHAFGLPHVDCYGYDLHQNGSIMSYNQAHWSRGLTRSATPGGFTPEEYFMLSLNQRALPGFVYDPRKHGVPADMARMQRCFSPAMGENVSPLRDLPGVGFELFYDGKRVNGPDAALYSRVSAESSCRSAREGGLGVVVGCSYNGRPF